ncbi:unnamed protein product [Didymodactylos carnosus]|uniref:Uncharacterized protein n=1 Tax=Didymodactylos carnosus TaxID=1234261 RepID=A0A816HDX2_9BILA|nr:unnamed protein product [Didymodactylos carnosus]CAF4701044.1 unnamed protein product [Didymodactylos carnosus]
MQMSVISTNEVVIIDKVEHNPLTYAGYPAWASLYNINDHSVIPLGMKSNAFCAGGSWLSNGTLINVGGDEATVSF